MKRALAIVCATALGGCVVVSERPADSSPPPAAPAPVAPTTVATAEPAPAPPPTSERGAEPPPDAAPTRGLKRPKR